MGVQDTYEDLLLVARTDRRRLPAAAEKLGDLITVDLAQLAFAAANRAGSSRDYVGALAAFDVAAIAFQHTKEYAAAIEVAIRQADLRKVMATTVEEYESVRERVLAMVVTATSFRRPDLFFRARYNLIRSLV